jgi:ribonuclease VapC
MDLMVVDTSALVAILFREADADRLGRILADAQIRMMSAVTRVELSCVVEGRQGEAGRASGGARYWRLFFVCIGRRLGLSAALQGP